MQQYRPRHYQELCSWYRAWGITPPQEETLAKIGFISPGVAACFVYKGDKIALIEGLVSNPEAPKEDRQLCIKAVLKACLEEAKGLRVFATPTNEHARRWATKIGMSKTDKVLYMRSAS